MEAAVSPIRALHDAIRANDPEAVARTLERHPDLKSRLDDPLPDGAFGATPLLAAVHQDNRKIVDILLDAGADINARSDWWAGGFGVLDHDGSLTEYLIHRGAVVDVFAAARLGQLDRLAELIEKDPALVHARGGDGQTALHFARSPAVAEFLVDRGADIDARDIDHESTAAQWMTDKRHDAARYLVSRGCRTDILMASALGDADLVQRLLDADPASIRTAVGDAWFPRTNPRSAGTIYNWTFGAGQTAHVIARRFGHDGVLRLLMKHTPETLALVVACQLGDQAQVTSLVSAHPGLLSKLSGDELRALPDAARDENLTAVRLMLEAGWPIDARGQHGATALHWAGFHGNLELTRLLLRYNPPLDVKDRDFDGTPLSWTTHGSVHGWRAKTGNYVETERELREAGAA